MKSRDEILNLSEEELPNKLQELQEEMDNLQLQKNTHQLTNPMRIRQVRRNIARIKTLMKEFDMKIRVKKAEVKQ
ncbi:50S ribosomal protein L29 [Calditrichota bacterium]